MYKYSHESLRAVPRGFDGLVDVSTSLIADEETQDAETAVDVDHISPENQLDVDSDTLSAASEETLTAASDTLTASSKDNDFEMVEHQVQIQHGKLDD